MYDYEEPYGSYQKPRSSGMATAAMILGILALISGCCIYLSIPLGALGILLAILSKGSDKTYSPASKAGLLVSVMALVITVSMTAVTLISNWDLIQSGTFQQQLEDILEYYYGEDSTDSSQDVLPYGYGFYDREGTPGGSSTPGNGTMPFWQEPSNEPSYSPLPEV